MITMDDLGNMITEALKYYEGKASLVEICKYIWGNYENKLRDSGDLFYTWQYRIRWQATQLRKKGVLKPAGSTKKGIWEMNENYTKYS